MRGNKLGSEWRELALKFDNQRMQALWHIRALLADPAAAEAEARKFIAAPPVDMQGLSANQAFEKGYRQGRADQQQIQQARLAGMAEVSNAMALAASKEALKYPANLRPLNGTDVWPVMLAEAVKERGLSMSDDSFQAATKVEWPDVLAAHDGDLAQHRAGKSCGTEVTPARPTKPGWYVVLPPDFDAPTVRAFGKDGRWWVPLGKGNGEDGWMTGGEYANWVGPIADIDDAQPFLAASAARASKGEV